MYLMKTLHVQRIVAYGQGNFRTLLNSDIANENGRSYEPRISLASAPMIEIALDGVAGSEAHICAQVDENQLVVVEFALAGPPLHAFNPAIC